MKGTTQVCGTMDREPLVGRFWNRHRVQNVAAVKIGRAGKIVHAVVPGEIIEQSSVDRLVPPQQKDRFGVGVEVHPALATIGESMANVGKRLS